MKRIILIAVALCSISGGAFARDFDFTLPGLSPTASNFDKLYYAFRVYAMVRACNEARKGYAMIYLNEVEMDRARVKIKAIETEAIPTIKLSASDDAFVRLFFRSGTLDTTAMFSDAVISIQGKGMSYDNCHTMLRALFAIRTDTGNMVIEKDF
jgi:hypothetical protein